VEKFEAVAQGLASLRKNEWVEGIEERFGIVKVSVAEVRIEHQVKIADFMKWLERPGRTPREITSVRKFEEFSGCRLQGDSSQVSTFQVLLMRVEFVDQH